MGQPQNLRSPRPFLKWAGGKGQMLSRLMSAVDQGPTFINYHEPFLGGGALFFELQRQERIPGASFLSDTNPYLVQAFLGVRDRLSDTCALARQMFGDHSRQQYEDLKNPRRLSAFSTAAHAARMLYLNRACFNGLYRENSRGEFNVPWGKREDIGVPDEKNLHACSRALALAWVGLEDWKHVMGQCQPGDLVYFDPPYLPETDRPMFGAYGAQKFGKEEHRLLADAARALVGMGVNVMLTQSDCPMTRKLYWSWHIHSTSTNRPVNSKADRGDKARELVITSWPCRVQGAVTLKTAQAVR